MKGIIGVRNYKQTSLFTVTARTSEQTSWDISFCYQTSDMLP